MKAKPIPIPNERPEAVVNAVFEAVRIGPTGVLRFQLLPFGKRDLEKDCLALCNPGNEIMKEWIGNYCIPLSDFKYMIQRGSIVGSPVVSGNEASVNLSSDRYWSTVNPFFYSE